MHNLYVFIAEWVLHIGYSGSNKTHFVVSRSPRTVPMRDINSHIDWARTIPMRDMNSHIDWARTVPMRATNRHIDLGSNNHADVWSSPRTATMRVLNSYIDQVPNHNADALPNFHVDVWSKMGG